MLADVSWTTDQLGDVQEVLQPLFKRAVDKYDANVAPMLLLMKQRSFFHPGCHHTQQEFHDLFTEPQFSSDSWEFELHQYCSAPSSSLSPAQFWAEKENELPRLSGLAMQLLCVPSSSAYVESCFSVARDVQRLHRDRMSSQYFKDELRCRVSRGVVGQLMRQAAV